MTDLAIIADDLSGALDTAAPFAMRGLKTVVALGPDSLDVALASGAAIVGVSTDSRETAPGIAREAVGRALERIPRGTRLFKKIDSRLKGNLVAELDAFDYFQALVVPAIPAFDRWVREGMLGGFGVENPIDIGARLGSHAARSTIPDAATQADITDALKAFEGDLLVGARALAEAIATRLAANKCAPETMVRARAIIFVVGSTDPITLGQVDQLMQSRPDIAYIAAPAGLVPDVAERKADLMILHATPDGSEVAPATVSSRLASAVEALDPADETLLVICGGATAQVVLGQFGIGSVEVLGEALPGLPLADAGRFKLITKSGGFGAPDVFLDVLDKFGVCPGRRGL